MKNITSLGITCICVLITSSYVPPNPQLQLRSQNTSAPSSIYGVFEGRIPCQEIAKELGLKVSPVCTKRKILLTLFQDSVSQKPTIYKIQGMGEKSGEGKWHLVKGSAIDPLATVYKLDMADKFLLLYKGSENVLFILDMNKNFLIGNDKFSYTLNRVRSNNSWNQWLYLANKGRSF